VASHTGQSFLASATPAAGKTTFGLRVAYEMLASGRVDRVVVAAPTTHICRQWSADAARYGIDLEPNRPNRDGLEPRDRHGVAVTYQTIAAGPALHARGVRRATLLIADEPHHMGDQAAWGTRTRQAFGGAVFRLLLSGTPRLRVGVYATAARTELFFRQVVGRFVRRTTAPARQMSYLLLPADLRLKQLAVQIEEERRHALDLGAGEDGELIEQPLPERAEAGERFEALSSSAAELHEQFYSETTLQLFPTDDPPRPPARVVRPVAPPPPEEPEPETASQARRRLRAERARLAPLVSRKTGEPHSAVHARINRATGARSVGAATREQLEKGNALLSREL
jgi:superfamily II DNA or RNA helicase